MLEFYDYNVTYSLEVPNEICLNYHIANCQNHCVGCLSPELWKNTGISLVKVYRPILEAYSERITCVCFLGEGSGNESEHNEFRMLCEQVHNEGFKTCLYSGRNCGIESWMSIFDYVKLGAYNESCGDLSCPTTNQHLFRKTKCGYEDITYLFWS